MDLNNIKGVKMELEKEDLGELIESLQYMGKALVKIQKQLGIKEVSLPILDEGEIQNG
jgi:hypothetical protein